MPGKNVITTPLIGELSATQKKEISSYLDSFGNKLSPIHREQFLTICRVRGLNPLLKEIYGIPYRSENGQQTFSIIVAYEVYIRVAEESGLLKGWKVWTEGNVENGDFRACIEIYRDGWDLPFYHEILFKEYAQWKKDGKGNWALTKFWRTKPATMCKKVAIAQGFRLCFASRYVGMPYIEEESGEIGAETKPEITTRKVPPSQEPQKEKNEKVEEAQVVEPKEVNEPQEITQEVMRNQIYNEFGDDSQFTEFLCEKKWFGKGSNLRSLTDGQILRLYNNKDKMINLYNLWKKKGVQ